MISTPDRQEIVALINDAVDGGACLKKASEAAGISPRTFQRWTGDGCIKSDGRPTAERKAPANKLSPEERTLIVATCNSEEYASLPPSQIVPDLVDQGVYIASESSFYRVLREAGQMQRRGKAQPPQKRPKPKPFSADGPNQLWSWDITYLATTIQGIFYRLYMVMDVYSRKIVGWEVHANETAERAAELIEKACWAERVRREQLVLHADNGSPMKGATMLARLQKLGIMPSFSRPSVSNDNPYSESLFGTMKYTPAFPTQPFDSLDDARTWVQSFVQWYNGKHRHSALKFVTPAERHQGKDKEILQRRKAVYEAAKRLNPQRWAKATRNWDHIDTVWLNPEKIEQEVKQAQQLERAA